MCRLITILACSIAVTLGCSAGEEAGAPGTQGAPCETDDGCEAGLLCVEAICSESPEADVGGIVEVDVVAPTDTLADTAADGSSTPDLTETDGAGTQDTGPSDPGTPDGQTPLDGPSLEDGDATLDPETEDAGPSLWPCESSKDCPPGEEVCDKDAGLCVECVTTNDCEDDGHVCLDNACVPGESCGSDKDCTDDGLVCDLTSGACVECVEDADCVDGGTCVNGECLNFECGNGELEEGEACDDGLDETPACKYGQTSCTVCSANCELVEGETSYCGDGEVDSEHGEECDDGNTTTEPCPADGDGDCTVCQATCVEGPGASLTGPGGCPIVVIEVVEGLKVAPVTKLHLVGSKSTSGSGVISQYKWGVTGPEGSSPYFFPNSTVPDPTFNVNVAGAYTFTLRVWDEEGVQSCEDGEVTVNVTPVHMIHVELSWHTPADPDEFDEGPEAGADLDLHFLHPYATGMDNDQDGVPDGWFDNPFDCFWFNSMPNWGAMNPQVPDDPMLILDDTDGAGPEVITLDMPEEGMVYRVGAHYWSDADFGTSYATVRIFFDSELVYEVASIELQTHDMWEVASIAVPSGLVVPATNPDGEPKITPDYKDPFFVP